MCCPGQRTHQTVADLSINLATNRTWFIHDYLQCTTMYVSWSLSFQPKVIQLTTGYGFQFAFLLPSIQTLNFAEQFTRLRPQIKPIINLNTVNQLKRKVSISFELGIWFRRSRKTTSLWLTVEKHEFQNKPKSESKAFAESRTPK